MKEPSLTKEIAAVVAMAVVVGFVFNTVSGRGLPIIRVDPVRVAVADSAIFGPGAAAIDAVPSAPRAETAAGDAFRIITLDQMKRATEGRRGILFDARTPDEFAAGHIPGAENLYAMAPESWVERVGDLPRDTLLIVYCSNPHCPFGKTLAELLGSFGFNNLLLFDEGWDAWTAAGLPSSGGKEGPAR